jgi:4-alpha-glucanotransferase
VLPWQDVLGTRDRINLPGSQGEANWSYRVSQRNEELLEDEQSRRGAEFLAELTEKAKR